MIPQYSNPRRSPLPQIGDWISAKASCGRHIFGFVTEAPYTSRVRVYVTESEDELYDNLTINAYEYRIMPEIEFADTEEYARMMVELSLATKNKLLFQEFVPLLNKTKTRTQAYEKTRQPT